MWNPQPGILFWNEVPETLEPGEVVLELELHGPVYQGRIPRLPADDDLQFEEPEWSSCGRLDEYFHYSVKRVLAGELSDKEIVVVPGIIARDETLNPLKKRIVVGDIIGRDHFTQKMLSRSLNVFEAPVLDPRSPPGPDKSSQLVSAYWTAEGAVFWPATIIGGLLPGSGGTRHAAVAIGLIVLGAIVVLAAFFVSRGVKRRRNRPHS